MHVDILQKRIIWKTRQIKPWRGKQQIYFLDRMGELLEEGFPLRDALQFLSIMMPKEREDIESIETLLGKGGSFPDALSRYGFADHVVTQIHFSLLHSRLPQTLRFCAQFLELKQKQLAKLQKSLLYPLFLLVFTTGTLLVIRSFLLPQLESSAGEDPSMLIKVFLKLLKYFPQLIWSMLLLPTGTALFGGWILHKKPALEKALLLIRLPIIGRWLISYYTFFFSREFAYFFYTGHSLLEILQTFQRDPATPLMKQLAKVLENGMLAGESFPHLVQTYPLFRPEMTWLIYQGELTGLLGTKLELYSKECHANLMADIEKKINLLQPLLFLLIGIIIVLVYGALMLPTISILKGVL